MILKRPILFSLAFGIIASSVIGMANYLPYSAARDAITDGLTLPGGLIADVVYPEGVHTGSGAPNWALMAGSLNLVIYILFAYILLRVTRYFRRRGQPPAPASEPNPRRP